MAKTKAEFAGASIESIRAKDNPLVKVRVLKAGDGKISTGKHDPRGGDELYEFGEEPEFPKDIAEALEARHLVEIQAVKKAA